MAKFYDTACDLISKQQKGKENTAVYGVGEQLKEICSASEKAAEIVVQDLANEDMSISNCEKKIKALADERHKYSKSNSVYVSPAEAEGIIREFYGLPDPSSTGNYGGCIDLDAYL